MFAWGKFRLQAETELAQLRQMLAVYAPFPAKCRDTPPNLVECAALATLLHSFYTGIENILKRVTLEIDRAPVEGPNWHQRLLLRVAEPGENRPAVLSAALFESLQDYLGFRHFFRNAYSHTFDWDEMKPLVLDCGNLLQRFEAEIAAFLEREPA